MKTKIFLKIVFVNISKAIKLKMYNKKFKVSKGSSFKTFNQ